MKNTVFIFDLWKYAYVMYQTCIVLKILTFTNVSPGRVLVATAVVTFYFVRNTVVITLYTMQNTIQNCYNMLQHDHLHCSSLSAWPPRTIHPSNILHSSADNCIFCILNRQKKFQGLCIFFSPVLRSGTISLSLCNMLKLCLRTSSQDSPFLCFLLLTLPACLK